MNINFGNITYKNDLGQIVSKEEFDKEREKFKNDVREAYENKVNELILRINSRTSDDKEKLWLLYDYLTGENMRYDLQGTTLNGRMATGEGYPFPPYKTWRIFHSDKYPAILNNAGVCITFSKAFADISNKMGIACIVTDGYTGMEHAWNAVLINNEVKHIDVAYALMNRTCSDKKNYFLKDISQLIQIAGSRTCNAANSELENELITKYNQLHPENQIPLKITIKEKPKITINEEPKITIINRNDDNER